MKFPGYAAMCDPCKVGSCERVCVGAAINSISDAQKMKGCTIINGSLEIKIMDGNDVFQELETYLADIKEITGYLKVNKTFYKSSVMDLCILLFIVCFSIVTYR